MIVPGADLVEVRQLKRAATQRLLGDTISISDDDWLGPTALPGWTRAHVATHLARNADVLRRYVTRLASRPELERDDLVTDLEAGARRSPLDIQIDLDTSSGLLNDTFDKVTAEQWSTPLHGGLEGLTVEDLPMMRLNEVVLHHVDLDCGFVMSDIDPRAAEWLLAWNVHRRTDLANGPGIRLTTGSGQVLRVGSGFGMSEVSGSAANLLGWLTGRLPRTAVSGAEHVSIGPLR
ncbi:MAG TPA: maleylpyruvate isomerase family mycothiol-dependent enzyme [Propionibacteriaceae bacterium]|nr:maleylpyruvate isomerase family mycothiol-dependent enzyme [Propionibacteriaceae bacterium]